MLSTPEAMLAVRLLRVVPPAYELAPVRTRPATPATLRPPGPVMTPLMVVGVLTVRVLLAASVTGPLKVKVPLLLPPPVVLPALKVRLPLSTTGLARVIALV